MAKTKEDIKVDSIVSQYTTMLDYDFINNIIKTTDNTDIGKISEKTIRNICKWALNGLSSEEISANMELTQKQFNLLCTICPTIVYVMQSSYAFADMVIAGTMFERAIGHCKIKKQVLAKVKDYNENGQVCGEHYDKIWVEEELPPDPNLLKYIAEKRLSEKFGEKVVDDDEETRKVVKTLTPEQMAFVEKQLNEK